MIVVTTILMLCAFVMLITETDLPSAAIYGLIFIIFQILTMAQIDFGNDKKLEDVEYKVSVQLLNPKGEVIITNGEEIDTIDVDRIPYWIGQYEM